VISLRSTFLSLHRLSARKVLQDVADLLVVLFEQGYSRAVAQGLLGCGGPHHVRKEQRDQSAMVPGRLHTWRSTGWCGRLSFHAKKTLTETLTALKEENRQLKVGREGEELGVLPGLQVFNWRDFPNSPHHPTPEAINHWRPIWKRTVEAKPAPVLRPNRSEAGNICG
jgi:hypothetical protein